MSFLLSWKPIALISLYVSIMSSVCLEIVGLNNEINEKLSINQLSLTIEKGKKVALLGLNGAGKTSLIKLLLGESEPDSGQIQYYLNNKKLLPYQLAFKSQMGYQSDNMMAIKELSVKDYLRFCAFLKDIEQKQVDGLIKSVCYIWGLENLTEHQLTTLSKGNLQKVALAQTYLNKPKFLFFDEPCQNLDPVEQDRFLKNITDLKGFDLCLFSTHDVEQAVDIADHVLVFHQANLVFQIDLESNSDYLLLLKNTSQGIESNLTKLALNYQMLGERIVLVKKIKRDQVEDITSQLNREKIEIEFFLPTKEAILPLFKLLEKSVI